MSFQQALSGLNGAATSLETISNNIANAGTVGFKQSVTQFSDLYASSLTSNATAQVGMGSAVSSVNQRFTQGNINSTNNPLDLAINGNGMFPMTADGKSFSYTRNGQFQLDKSGAIVDASGLKLCGYAANSNGTITPSDPPVPLSVLSTIPFKQTTTSAVNLNLSSLATQPTAMTRGSLWPAAAPVAPATLGLTVNAANNGLSIALDGQPPQPATGFAVNLTQKTYLNVYDLAAGVQADINNALVQQGSTSAVDVTYNTGGYLQIQSRGVGQYSGIFSTIVPAPLPISGTAVANLFGTGGGVLAAGTPGLDNFDPANPNSYTSTTSETVYDTSGNAHTVSMYFVKTATPNQWQTYMSIDGQAANINSNYPVGGATYTNAFTLLNFNSTGQLTTMTPPALGTPPNGFSMLRLSNGNVSTSPTVDVVVDLSKATQNSLNFGVTSIVQNGYAAGNLSGVAVDKAGIIQGTYTNGQSQPMAQLALVGFRNPSALQAVGNNQWAETIGAGKQPSSAPGKDGMGTVQSGAVEQSNVDLTKELVDMITQQRAYQANAQSIKTQDQIMQTIVNLR